jgi:hypothetical protein
MSFRAKVAENQFFTRMVCMSDQIFQDAYARVRGRHSDQAWFAFSPREITDAIYREIRVIDGERLARAQADATPVNIAAE